MALNKNTIFFHDIRKIRGYTYRLYFVPGDIADLSAPAEVEFPHDVIMAGGVIYSAAYGSDLPLGAPKKSTLAIELNISRFNIQGGNDWQEVLSWILSQKSDAQRAVYINSASYDFYIPNRWYIKRSNDNFISSELIADCMQGPGAFTYENESTCQVNCFDITQYARAGLNFGMFSLGSPAPLGEVQRLYYNWWASGGAEYVLANSFNDYRVEPEEQLFYQYARLYDIFDFADSAMQSIIRAYRRGPATSVKRVKSPFSHISFYKSTRNKNAQAGAPIKKADELMAIPYVRQGSGAASKFVGGLLLSGARNLHSWAKEHENNFEDFMAVFAESALAKQRTVYKGPDIYIIWQELFNSYNYDAAGEENAAQDSFVSIDTGDILKNYKFETGLDLVRGVAHIGDLHEEGDSEISVSSVGAAGAGRSGVEVKLQLHNQPAMPHEEGALDNWYSNKNVTPVEYAIIQQLWVKENDWNGDGALVGVHDWCKIRLSATAEVESEDISAFGDLPAEGDPSWFKNTLPLKDWSLDRQKISGLGYTTAKAINYALCNEFQGKLECETHLENAAPEDLGRLYSIDINELLDISPGWPLDSNAGNCVLVNVETDFYRGISKCIFFIRGDRQDA